MDVAKQSIELIERMYCVLMMINTTDIKTSINATEVHKGVKEMVLNLIKERNGD